MTYRGKVKNGVVVLEEGAKVPEGTPVRVEILDTAAERTARSSWGERLLKLAGSADGLPSDLARNHDHYLHGRPKK